MMMIRPCGMLLMAVATTHAFVPHLHHRRTAVFGSSSLSLYEQTSADRETTTTSTAAVQEATTGDETSIPLAQDDTAAEAPASSLKKDVDGSSVVETSVEEESTASTKPIDNKSKELSLSEAEDFDALADEADEEAPETSSKSEEKGKNSVPAEARTEETEEVKMFEKEMFEDDIVDSDTLLQESSFPIDAETLKKQVEYILSPDVGIGSMDGGECLADNFVFCGSVIGPLDKDDYLAALQSFNLGAAFDITPNFFGLTVDPLQPNRVWFFNRVEGTHVGPFMGKAPDGKKIVYPPQVHHLDFNELGEVTEYGFYTADRLQGNTGGLGGAFGFMYAIGRPLPIPECRPYKRSRRFRTLNLIGRVSRSLQGTDE